MKRHLAKVVEIAEKFGYELMIWSDMYFRAWNDGKYYMEKKEVPKEYIDALPKSVIPVYWDYYNAKESIYDDMLYNHAQLSKKTWFAGGVWTWGGFAPLNNYSLIRSPEALKAMEEALDVYNGSISYTIDRTDDILQGPINALINGTAVMGIMHYAEYVPNRVAKEMTNFGVLPWPSGPDVSPGFIATQHISLERAIVISRFSPNIDATAIVLNALYEPFAEYPDRDAIKDFLYKTFFFDSRDAGIFYDMFRSTQCTYFPSLVCDSLGGWVDSGQTPTQYIESNIDKLEEYIKDEVAPSKRGAESIWGK
jgi:hypothetical protein